MIINKTSGTKDDSAVVAPKFTPGRGANTTPAGAHELIAAGLNCLNRGQSIIGRGYILSGIRELKCWHPEVFADGGAQ